MKVSLFCTGKNSNNFVNEGVMDYCARITRYVRFEIIYIPEPKKKKTHKPEQVKLMEAETQLRHVSENSYLILLDEKGKMNDSVAFAAKLDQFLSGSVNNLAFLIGGAYGFHETVYKRANELISLSKMTFSHQLIRVLFLEQLYRGFTILRNEPYHNA